MVDVHLLVRHNNLTIFMTVDDNSLVLELKKMIQGILRVPHQNQQLHFKNNIMDENKTLSDNNVRSKAVLKPAIIGLTLRKENGDFEQLDICAYLTDIDILEETDDE